MFTALDELSRPAVPEAQTVELPEIWVQDQEPNQEPVTAGPSGFQPAENGRVDPAGPTPKRKTKRHRWNRPLVIVHPGLPPVPTFYR